MTPACESLLEPRGSGLELLKFTFNAEDYICRLSWYISSFWRNLLLKCVLQPKIAKKSTKTSIWGVQDRSRSLILMSIKRAYVTSYLAPFLRFGDLLTQNGQFLYPLSFSTLDQGDPFRISNFGESFTDPKTKVSVAVHGENFVILACVVFTQYRSVTNGQTDGQTPRRWLRRAKHYMLSRVTKKTTTGKMVG